VPDPNPAEISQLGSRGLSSSAEFRGLCLTNTTITFTCRTSAPHPLLWTTQRLGRSMLPINTGWYWAILIWDRCHLKVVASIKGKGQPQF